MGQTILVIDDDHGHLETLSDILSARRYVVATAPTGEAALARLKSNGIRAALMDVLMPGLNGVETVRRMRPWLPPNQIILMTAYTRHGLIDQARQEGVRAILPKPLEMPTVLALLDDLLGGREGPR
jgi:CheY-like chemotaxis protein